MVKKLRELDLIISTLTSTCYIDGKLEHIMLIYSMINGFNRENIRDKPDYSFKYGDELYTVEHFHVPTTGEVGKKGTSDKLRNNFYSHKLSKLHSSKAQFIKSFDRVYNGHIEEYHTYKENIGENSKLIFFIDYELLFFIGNNNAPLSPIALREVRDIILKQDKWPDLIVFKSTLTNGADMIWVHDMGEIASFSDDNVQVFESELEKLEDNYKPKNNKYKKKLIRILCMFEDGFEPDTLFIGIRKSNKTTYLDISVQNGEVISYDITDKNVYKSNMVIKKSSDETSYVLHNKDKKPNLALILSLDNTIFKGQQEINIRI